MENCLSNFNKWTFFLVHYEYMALAKRTSVLREAILSFVEPVDNSKLVPRRVCGHILKPC